ncbi:hypothetical protein AAHA92_04698 [Salvia divinorum]|uniref:Uncharacterized protein n=1 Tax=Salvia divinorum TaxID=28513 RepID=A0ABD1I246_SALDI
MAKTSPPYHSRNHPCLPLSMGGAAHSDAAGGVALILHCRCYSYWRVKGAAIKQPCDRSVRRTEVAVETENGHNEKKQF